ncbi:MAG: EutN/CcmL family microcompartment protein [Pikeienuella sp.]
MKLALVTGTVEAAAKDAALAGSKMLLVDLVDGGGAVIEPAVVAIDTAGAGVGDQVLLTFNGAARMPGQTAGSPVDAAIIAVIDRVSVAASGASKKRKS